MIGVFWRLGQNERVSEGLEAAGNIYLAMMDQAPNTGLLWKAPVGSPGELVVKDEKGSYQMTLREEGQLPEKCVFVFREREEAKRSTK